MRLRTTIVVVCLFLSPASLRAEAVVVEQPAASATADPEAIVEAYLEHFFERTNGHLLRHARKNIPLVVAAAQKEGLDPLLLAIVISCESTWKPKSVGKIGEVGLMQVHGEAAKGFAVDTVEGNLAAGAAWLASRLAKHGSLEGGMAAYMGGGPRATKAAKWRLKKYRDEIKRQGIEGSEKP
jgi:soluble lytic murein transglycosylase-like protein